MTKATREDWKKAFHEALAEGRKQDALQLLKENHVFEVRSEKELSNFGRETTDVTGPHILQQWGVSKIEVEDDLLSFDMADLGDDNVALAMLYEDRSWRSNLGYSGGIGWYWKGEVAVLNLDKGVGDTNTTDTICVRDPDNGNRDIFQYIDKKDILHVQDGRATVRLGNYASASVLTNGLDLNNKELVTEEFIKELRRDELDYKKIQMLIQAGANPNVDIIRDQGTRGEWKTTPLRILMGERHNFNGDVHYYYFHDYEEISKDAMKTIDLLLKNGADVSSEHYYDDKTPLMCAIKKSNLDLVKLLMKYGADIEHKYRANRLGYEEMLSLDWYVDESSSTEVRQFLREELKHRWEEKKKLNRPKTEKEEPKAVETLVVKPKKTEKTKKGSILKTLDLAAKARILDEDETVAALRHEREDIMATATAGIKDPKKKNAILRRINVQDLRDKEGKARAARLLKEYHQARK